MERKRLEELLNRALQEERSLSITLSEGSAEQAGFILMMNEEDEIVLNPKHTTDLRAVETTGQWPSGATREVEFIPDTTIDREFFLGVLGQHIDNAEVL